MFAFSQKFFCQKCFGHTKILSIFPAFSSHSFIISSFTFRSLIHLELIFVCLRDSSLGPLCVSLSSFPSTIYWRDFSFSSVFLLPFKTQLARAAELFLIFHSILLVHVSMLRCLPPMWDTCIYFHFQFWLIPILAIVNSWGVSRSIYASACGSLSHFIKF